MIPLQNIPRASRHCSSYRSLPLGEQQPWGLLLLGLTSLPSTNKVRGASPSRSLCELNNLIIPLLLSFFHLPSSIFYQDLSLGLTPVPHEGSPPLFTVYRSRQSDRTRFPRYSRDSLGRKGKIVFIRPSSQP